MDKTPLSYKGKPLVRCNNEIYYGDPKESHVIFMQILSTKQEGDNEVADKVHVSLLSNDASLTPRARIVKESEKNGLFAALDIGAIWLERAIKEGK